MTVIASLSHPPHVGADGIWCQVVQSLDGPARPSLFLDRDGVIVEEVHYLHRVEDMRLTSDAAEVIRQANAADIPVVVVTNQSGVGRGTFGWPAFAAVQDAMLAALAAAGAHVNAVYACPFHASGIAPWNVADHHDRKPGPGMLLRASQALPVDLAGSWIIGDRSGDIGAARNAGLAGGMHVLSGHGNDDGERADALRYIGPDFQVTTGLGIGDFSVDTLTVE